MIQQPQVPDEPKAPPDLAQILSILVGIGSVAGVIIFFNVFVPERLFGWVLVAILVAVSFGYTLTLACVSRFQTGSWSDYPSKVKNIRR